MAHRLLGEVLFSKLRMQLHYVRARSGPAQLVIPASQRPSVIHRPTGATTKILGHLNLKKLA
uniref:Uncharacterized protein n=1 Tax=Arundo donax TaxID=35708 RepID=A0A0A9FP61_ARUDO